MKKTKFRGFTLVELLAVIVILAIILVIAVPQIMKTIDSARLGAFRGTAKLILTQAEKQHLVDQTLKVDEGNIGTTTYQGTGNGDTECGKLAKLGSDYSACKITVDSNGKATLVTLTGTGKFANYSCANATLSNVESTCNKSGSSSSSSESGSSSANQIGTQTLIASCTGTCLKSGSTPGTPNSDGLFQDENGDYRYTGAEPSNYATFNGETWRIIGIFDGRIKLLRNEVIGNAGWDSKSPYSNAWEGSEIELRLNNDYLTSTGYLGKSLSSDAQNLIDTVYWYTTAITYAKSTASAYNAERANANNKISRKVGLIYPSDYGYASSACKDITESCVKYLNGYDDSICTTSNWMYTNMSSSSWWTILPLSGSASNRAMNVKFSGNVSYNNVYSSGAVRPVVYLKSNVSISGDGKTTYYTFS